MKALLLMCSILPLALAASAKDLDCSIHVKKKLDMREYEAMAKVAPEQARKIALEKVAAEGSKIAHGGLEVEDGCLVYAYDIQVPGRKGFEEIIVDAGTGTVIKTEHESAAREKLEKTLDPKKNLNKAP